MQTLKTVAITIVILLGIGVGAVATLSYVMDHCGWETGTCR